MGNSEVTIAIRGKCNYSCSYCVGNNAKETVIQYSLDRLEDIYARLQGLIVTNFECGASEPTVHPQISSILKIALKYGAASIPTNNSIEPKVWLPKSGLDKLLVRAALHPQGEEKLDEFTLRLIQMRDMGVRVCVIWVAHPTRLGNLTFIKDYFDYFNIPMDIVSFIGEYNGVKYPEGYTEDERELLGLKSESTYWYNRLYPLMTRDFFGIPCLAGYRSLYIAPDGNLWRCLYDGEPLDMPLDEATPCRAHYCGCGLLLEELNTLDDPGYAIYWRDVAGLPPLEEKPQLQFEDYSKIYRDLMSRYGKVKDV